jgi:putative MATE family efflux protein
MKQLDNEKISQNKMGTMPVGKLITSMSLPAMFSMIINALYNIIDSIFVGMIGEHALAAVTLVFPIQMLLISLGVGTGIGLNSLISRRLGERNFTKVNSAASHGILIAIANWVVFAIFGLFFSASFIKSFSDNPDIIADGSSYGFIISVFSIFIMIHISAEKILQATGNMVLPMICSLVGATTNIILDPILIFGLLGAPEMGVTGAAVATVIGQFIGMSLCLFFLFFKEHEVKINLRNFRIDWLVLKDIYSVGLPSIVMQSIGSVMLIGLNAILIAFSEAAVAVLGVYFRLQSFIFMPVFGLVQGLMPIMGYNYGAKNKKRLMEAFKLGLKMAIIIMLIGMIIFQIFPVQMLKLFSASPEMLRIGTNALRIISTCFVFAAIGIIASTLFQAMGYGFFSLFISVLRQIVIILPLAWIFARFTEVAYVWLAFPLAELFSLTASILLLRYIYNKEIKNLGKNNIDHTQQSIQTITEVIE